MSAVIQNTSTTTIPPLSRMLSEGAVESSSSSSAEEAAAPSAAAAEATVESTMAAVDGSSSSSSSSLSTTSSSSNHYHAHFDCFSGAAGDMLLAACIDAAATASTVTTKDSSISTSSSSLYSTNVQRIVQHIKDCIMLGIPELENEFDIYTSSVQKGGMGSIRALHVTVTSIYNHEPAPVPTAPVAATISELPSSMSSSIQQQQGDWHDHHQTHSKTKRQKIIATNATNSNDTHSSWDRSRNNNIDETQRLPLTDHHSTIGYDENQQQQPHSYGHHHDHDHGHHHDHHHHHTHDHGHHSGYDHEDSLHPSSSSNHHHLHNTMNHDDDANVNNKSVANDDVSSTPTPPILPVPSSTSTTTTTTNRHRHRYRTPVQQTKLRNLPEIRRLLSTSCDKYIQPWVKTMGITTFTELAYAEAQVHGCDTIDTVHFHEVGAIDSIVDIIGTLIVLHDILHIKTISCSRLPMGYGGSVFTQHGYMPIPAPATLLLLKDMPTCPGPYNPTKVTTTTITGTTGELVTPTGAALLRTLTKHCNPYRTMIQSRDSRSTTKVVGNSTNNNNHHHHHQQHLERYPYGDGRPPIFTIRKVGVGAGTKDFYEHPNIVRLMVGDDVVLL